MIGRLVLIGTLMTGCASGFDPKPLDEVPFRDRAQSQIDDDVRVTAAVPSAQETRDLFGVSLYKSRVQPVWLEIENMTPDELSFFPISLDNDYLTPIEVTSMNQGRKARQQIEQYFFQQGVDI